MRKRRLKKYLKTGRNWAVYGSTWHHHLPVFKLLISKHRNMKKIRWESEVKGVTHSFSAHFFTLSCFSSSSINQRATIACAADTKSVLCGLRGSRRIFITALGQQADSVTYHHAPRWKRRAWRADWPHVWSRHTHAAHVSHILLTDGSVCDLVSERWDTSGTFVSTHAAPVSHERTFGRGRWVFLIWKK